MRVGQAALLPGEELHYNPGVRIYSQIVRKGIAAAALIGGISLLSPAQQIPAASGARILLMPRKLVSGERATLAVLDVNGRLTPGVHVTFSNGDKLTTDATGRALFVAPLTTGNLFGSIEGRSGRVAGTILSLSEIPATSPMVATAPRVAGLSDRMEILGHGFCGDADNNRVTIGGIPALVLASSPAYLAVLPPLEMEPGPSRVQVKCGQKSSDEFTVVFVALELEARTTTLAPGEHRNLVVHVTGSTAKIGLEARNLAPEIAELKGGTTVRGLSSGGKENVATFELQGKQKGSFVISIRLVVPQSPPRFP